jgi:hypothetical protein
MIKYLIMLKVAATYSASPEEEEEAYLSSSMGL